MIDKLHVLGEDIYIGYSPEHDVKEYRFDLREYLSEWPDTVPQMLATRPFEKDTYIVKTKLVDHVIVWRPTSYDTEKTGVGRMWVAFFGKDGKKLGLTPVTTTHILPGPPNIDGDTPPEMRPTWVQDVLDAAQRTQDAAVSPEAINKAVAAYMKDNPVRVETDETLMYDENGQLSVKTADAAQADNTLPITSAAVHTTVGNIEVLLGTI